MRLSKRMTTLILALCLTLMAGPALAAYQTLRPWDIGSEVRSMQQALKTLGFDIKVDGTYGPISETAVRTFQEMNKLQPDGIAGNQTLSLLYTLALTAGSGAVSVPPASPDCGRFPVSSPRWGRRTRRCWR